MPPRNPAALLAQLLLFITLAGCAGGERRNTVIDTSFLRDLTETRNFSNGRPTGIQLTPAGDAVLYLQSGPRDVVRSLYEMNVESGEIRCLARAEDILSGNTETLSPEEKARRERMRESGAGLTSFQLSEDGSRVLTSLSGRLYVIDRASGAVTALAESDAGPAIDPKFSPDGRYVSCIRSYDIHLIDLESNTDRALTTGGTQDITHGIAEFVAQEEMDRRSGYWWSGDSRLIAYEVADLTGVPMRYIADPLHPNAEPLGWRYPNAGANNAAVKLGVIEVAGGGTRWADWDSAKYPYLAAVHWGKDAPLTIQVQTRLQQETVLYRIDPATLELTELVKETDPAWVNLDPDMPKWIDDGKRFLWTSERSGENRLELHAADGTLENSFELNGIRFDGVVSYHKADRTVIMGGGPTPVETKLYRLSLETGAITSLTDQRGEHSGVFSKEGDAWVHAASLSDGRIMQTLKKLDGSTIREMPSAAVDPAILPSVEWTSVNIDSRAFQAAIIRPRNFKHGAKYPIIASVYGGPGSRMVHASSRSYLREQWLADLGFIVIAADGRGTKGLGRDWERTVYRNVIDIPVNDQAAIIQSLAKQYMELDRSRVGVYGWSFGGYFSAMAVLKRPDVFHAAVAGAPVTDWEDYDTHYTERYMGLPSDNVEGYRVCNASIYADTLSRPLLLIHGTTDDNVYFQHTMLLHNALFLSGRPHDLLVLNGFTHMVPDPMVSTRLYERIGRFFIENVANRKVAH